MTDSTVRKISPALVAELRRAAAAGETVAALARRVGFSENAVRRAVRGRRGNHGIARKDCDGVADMPAAVLGRGESGRPPRIGAAVVGEIRAAIARGERLAEVAARFGVSRSHARRIAAGESRLDVEVKIPEDAVPILPPSEAERLAARMVQGGFLALGPRGDWIAYGIERIEEELTAAVGSPVQVKHEGRGNGASAADRNLVWHELVNRARRARNMTPLQVACVPSTGEVFW